ncbi:hypothetical protein FQA39_LY02544 [Lamprigera yunnana]|nr:hypothetical protein FQA39_LY02544 [Lamprigera yunnana]
MADTLTLKCVGRLFAPVKNMDCKYHRVKLFTNYVIILKFDDSKFEETVSRWLAEIEDMDSDVSDDLNEARVVESQHNSETTQSESDRETDEERGSNCSAKLPLLRATQLANNDSTSSSDEENAIPLSKLKDNLRKRVNVTATTAKNRHTFMTFDTMWKPRQIGSKTLTFKMVEEKKILRIEDMCGNEFIKKMWMLYAEQHWTNAIDLKSAVERLYEKLGVLEFDADHEAIYGMERYYTVQQYEKLRDKYKIGRKVCRKLLKGKTCSQCLVKRMSEIGLRHFWIQ